MCSWWVRREEEDGKEEEEEGKREERCVKSAQSRDYLMASRLIISSAVCVLLFSVFLVLVLNLLVSYYRKYFSYNGMLRVVIFFF